MLPDMRDRFVVGAGTTYAVNDKGGAATVALTEANLAVHDHSVDPPATTSAGADVSHTHTMSDHTHTMAHAHEFGGNFIDDVAATGAASRYRSSTAPRPEAPQQRTPATRPTRKRVVTRSITITPSTFLPSTRQPQLGNRPREPASLHWAALHHQGAFVSEEPLDLEKEIEVLRTWVIGLVTGCPGCVEEATEWVESLGLTSEHEAQ